MRSKLFLLAFFVLFLASCSSSRTTTAKKRTQSKANETQIKKITISKTITTRKEARKRK